MNALEFNNQIANLSQDSLLIFQQLLNLTQKTKDLTRISFQS